MKKMKLATLFAGMGFLASSVHAEYRLEMCTIPLNEVVIESVKPLLQQFSFFQHVFLRTVHEGTITGGFNFEPADPTKFMGGSARIGNQTYDGADCTAVLATDDQSTFDSALQKVRNGFDEAAKVQYSLFDYNCYNATKDVLEGAGYEVPENVAERLEGQKDAAAIDATVLRTLNEKCVLQ